MTEKNWWQTYRLYSAL